MPRYLALLRGINLGGHNKVAMADLRELTASLGHTDVATYIQSGNVVFSSPEASTVKLADDLEQAIGRELGVRSPVIVLSQADLAQVMTDNPFPDAPNPKYLHAVFRREEMSPAGIESVASAEERARAKGSRDQAVVVGRTMFLHTPDGFGRSELAAQLTKAKAMSTGTARNWATVTKLMAMLELAG
jgi:uncharacterized protein (DUF1697 family)